MKKPKEVPIEIRKEIYRFLREALKVVRTTNAYDNLDWTINSEVTIQGIRINEGNGICSMVSDYAAFILDDDIKQQLLFHMCKSLHKSLPELLPYKNKNTYWLSPHVNRVKVINTICKELNIE